MVSFGEMLDHCAGKSWRVKSPKEDFLLSPKEATVGHATILEMSDGTLIWAGSNWTGPYTYAPYEVTGEPPRFWIGEPE